MLPAAPVMGAEAWKCQFPGHCGAPVLGSTACGNVTLTSPATYDPLTGASSSMPLRRS